jgi:Rrf2 family protein
MNISKKTRYAARALVTLGHMFARKKKPVQLKDISKAEDISLRYLENIFSQLSKAGIIASVKGKGGGFSLARDPESITMAEVVQVLENPMSGIECISSPKKCGRSSECVTRKMWIDFSGSIRDYFGAITLKSLIETYGRESPMYYI